MSANIQDMSPWQAIIIIYYNYNKQTNQQTNQTNKHLYYLTTLCGMSHKSRFYEKENADKFWVMTLVFNCFVQLKPWALTQY